MYRYIIILIFAIALNKINSVKGQNVNCNSKPPRVDLDACCDIPQLVSDTIFDKCMEEAGDGPGGPPNGRPKRGHHHKRVHCKLTECTLKELKLIQNDEFDNAAIKSYIDTFDAEWRPILKTATDNCTAEAMAINISNNNDKPDMGDCKPKFMHFIPCIHQISFINCPANKYTDNAECNGAKEFMEKCPRPMRRGPPPPPSN